MPRNRTTEDDLTPAQRAERDAQLAAAPRLSDAEVAAMRERANQACDRLGWPRLP